MDRVVLPEAAAVKHPVQPVQHEVGGDQEQQRLKPERQLRQRAMAVVVECDQVVGVVNVEHHAGAEHQQPDAKHAGEHRHEEPVADVGDELALRHHGLPGLQAQKCESTVKTTASPIVTGTTFAIVWPSISTTSRGKLDIATSCERRVWSIRWRLRSRKSVDAHRPGTTWDTLNPMT